MPDPATPADPDKRKAMQTALDYMGLTAGMPIQEAKIDWVFIGSCTNSRISDLRAAAEVAKGRKVAGHVRAWVVPGSENIKRQAEAEGLDRVFTEAGFEWREPGCSMCLAANGDTRRRRGSAASRPRTATSSAARGRAARTHLASPAMAAAAAIAGGIADVPLDLSGQMTMEAFTVLDADRRADDAPEHRHRHHHPDPSPARRGRRPSSATTPSSRCATCPDGSENPDFVAQPASLSRRADPGRRRQLRLRLARARARCGR